MIPFALKQVWFWLALSGLLQCWFLLVFIPGRRYGGLWGRLYYCVFLTILEGVFCLGMIWHMDPRRMPHSFCVAQVALISLGSFGLTGVCASFSVANALAVFRPNNFDSGRAILAWNARYVPFVVAFPIIASAIHSSLLVTLNAVDPSVSDDLHCDATNPVWMRLVGYAGVPLVVSIPFLVLSCYTAFRFFKSSRTKFSDTLSTSDVADAFESASATQLYGQHENRRRALAFRLTSFLPHPPLFSKSTGAVKDSTLVSASASGIAAPDSPPRPTRTDYPLHQHPFPPIDSHTGQAFSPSLEGHDGVSIIIAEPGVVHMQAAGSYPADRGQESSMAQLDRRPKSNTPGSEYSGSAPVFAPNPLFRGRSPSTTELSGRASTQLQSVESGGDTQVGLAVTTDGMMTVPQAEEVSNSVGRGASEEHITGFAVTTDEPDVRAPSRRSGDSNSSQALSEVHTLHDLQRAQEALARYEQLSGERVRSSMSTTRTLITSPQYLFFRDRLADLAHSASSSPHVSGHRRDSSLVSSATAFSPLSAPHPDHKLLVHSPAGATGSPRSPLTPQKEHGDDIDILLNMLPRLSSDMRGHEHADHSAGDNASSSHGHGLHGTMHELDKKGQKWEWDDVDDPAVVDMDTDTAVARTVEPRDPLKRLGIYNPTPPTPMVGVLQQRRQKMRRKRELAENSPRKLWGAVWKLVLFQIAFFSVQLLASLSPILDSVHGTPTPFGTQHVALLLAAWGPFFVFWFIPNTLRFWTRWL